MTNKMKGPSKKSEIIANQARQHCGADFRLHGRDSEHGFDCIGLAADCLVGAGINCEIPTGYSMRSGTLEQFIEAMVLAGFAQMLSNEERIIEGDVILVRPSPLQWHLMIKSGDGFVHAHAGLGKVTFSPGKPQWPVIAIFRMMEN